MQLSARCARLAVAMMGPACINIRYRLPKQSVWCAEGARMLKIVLNVTNGFGQDSRESSASNWDLSSLCDSCCLNTGHQRMGAGTYANSASPGPGLLRRRYSVPEIIMRKHTLAQQKTDDEPLWLHHDTNHNVIEVVVNKQTASARALLNGRLSGPRTPPHRKSFGLRQHREQHHHGSLTGRSSSVESGAGGCTNDWLTGTIPTGPGTLTATGSDPNLAALKHRNLAGGRCSSPLCNGIGLTRAVANGTGGSLRSIHNNSLSCSSSSSVNSGVPLANGGVVGGVGVGGCVHHQQQQSHQQQQQQQQYYPVVPPYRDGDFSMRKTTLLRRMWSRELRRYERSGSWSPPLRRAPRRIYSVESIVASVEGHHSPSRAADDAESVLGERVPGRPGSSGSGSSVGSGRCATTATTTTTATTGTSDTTGTTSCLECAKLESQYNGDFGTGKKLLARTRSRDTIDCSGPVSGGQSPPVPVSPSDPATVDDRRQRRRQRMCSSQTADLGESEPIILASAVSAAATVLNGPNVPEGADQHPPQQPDEDEDEYPSHSSSVSSIASQSYRVSSAARARPDNESDLCEFLQQERLAAADGDGVDRAAGREVAAVRAGSAGAGDNSRERAPVANGIAGTAGPAAEAVEPAEPAVSTEQQFPVGSKRRPSEDSSVALSAALSEDSDSSEEAGSDIEAGDNRTTNGVDEAERVRLDEYISGLLLDNLNNIADAKELVLATDARDGETILGVYSERRAQLFDHKPTEADRQNNNQSTNVQLELQHAGSMKQKLTEKYFGDGGGVVCNSPPQPDKRKLSPKPGDGNDGAECDKENEEDVANNNSNSKGKSHISNNNDAAERNHRRQKHRAKGNGFFLRSGSKSPRPIDPAIHGGAAEFDLNGKYYFPAYGLETDPSDNTDIASEPEGLVLGKIGTGSTYDRGSAVVPRFSAMPRTESMEVQPSSTNSAEDDGDRRKGRRDEEDDVDDDDDNDDDDDDSDASSLVDSLDGFGPAQMMETVPRTRKPRHAVKGAVAGESTTSSTDRSPRHEKGEAFFVPIHAEKVAAFKIDERVVVADTMPLRIKERLNNRRRMMKWKQEQENLKKQRKMMRMIEQKRFYGEPAIQVISTIDKAISRKEFIPPGAKKSVFGGASAAIVRDTPSTPPAPTPFRAMKPKKRAGGPAATGSALRTELGMLESYKIDGKGNMQIQTTAAAGPGGRKGAAAPTLPAASKSPWGMSAEKRQGKPPHTQSATASTTVGSSARTASTGRTGTGKVPPATDGRRRQQVLKDVQQMTLYPQADLTPDIEGGPRRVYQKTEIQEGDKHIEILEIVECADSAPRNRHGGASRPARVHSAGRRHERGRSDAGNNRNRSRIPVPIYRFGHYGRSIHSRDGSPLSTGSNPKVDRMIADLLLEALTNPEEVGVKLVRTPEALRDASRSSTKSRPVAASSSKKSSASSTCGTGSGTNGNNNLLTPRRTASGRYTQKFEVIPEERSSVSIESSTEELSTGGGGGSRKKGPHPSPRRVSFDENHQILNRDELEPPTLVVPSPSPKRQPAATSPAKSPTRAQPPAGAGVKKQGTA
uniref:Uncharacterized protein n=1 Tax=Anopheles christyi TaxID=43041 RepID=A0A182K6D7_9DIPT